MKMGSAAYSVFIYSFYMIGMGISFVVSPNSIITLFRFEPTNEIWIRMLGMLSFIAGGYYMVAAKSNLVPFFHASVLGRLIFALGEIVLVLIGKAPVALVSFALLEGSGAFWTWVVLKGEKENK